MRKIQKTCRGMTASSSMGAGQVKGIITSQVVAQVTANCILKISPTVVGQFTKVVVKLGINELVDELLSYLAANVTRGRTRWTKSIRTCHKPCKMRMNVYIATTLLLIFSVMRFICHELPFASCSCVVFTAPRAINVTCRTCHFQIVFEKFHVRNILSLAMHFGEILSPMSTPESCKWRRHGTSHWSTQFHRHLFSSWRQLLKCSTTHYMLPGSVDPLRTKHASSACKIFVALQRKLMCSKLATQPWRLFVKRSSRCSGQTE